MNMMQMVGIMVFFFFVSLTVICLYHEHINKKIGNIIFIVIDVVFFLGWNYAAFQRGWLADGFMTLDNITPFTLTLIPFTLLLNEKVKSYCNSAIAFLWIGMFLALSISPEHSYIFSFAHEANFTLSTEAACHLIASLYGIYLIISGQVKCDFDHLVKAVVCMYSVIGFGVILNYIFHTRNFQMDPYGNYSIYMIDIFGSFGATLAAYLLGVLLVLIIGMQVGYALNKSVSKIHIESIEKLLSHGKKAKETENTVELSDGKESDKDVKDGEVGCETDSD